VDVVVEAEDDTFFLPTRASSSPQHLLFVVVHG
jgi:hypothetical protein